MATLIHKVGHGLAASDAIMFGNLVGGAGLEENHTYYVLAAGLTADDFAVSETDGGAAVPYTTDILDGVVTINYEYVAVDDGTTTPPDPVPTPSVPTVTSAEVSGIVRLIITLNGTLEAKVRQWDVQVTSKYDTNGDEDWTNPRVLPAPEGTTELSIPATGSTQYSVRVRAVDVYGNLSSWCADVVHTTLAGNDSLAASIALLANDVQDGVITTTKIADGSITTPLLAAGAVTADILAATIVLASLIKTADTGRRVELDGTGITLYDSDESLLVRIPTNGDPVYVKGQVNADSLISQTSAELRTAVSFAGSSASTLQNGVATPSTAPGVVASVDSLTLTSTPSDLADSAGIGYDSAAGTFWIAADPTQSGGYVAHEFNATTGAYVRSIMATGSLSTVTTTLGSTSHVSDTAQATSGTSDSQVATPLTMPRDGRITKVSVYMAGYLGSCTARVAVWNTSSVSLAESASFTVASRSFATGESDQYNKSLSSPLSVTSGTTYRVGFLRTSSGDGFQWDRDDGSGKTTYLGDGLAGDMTGVSTDSSRKPNVYITYEYDVDTRLETAKNIGVCTDGTHVYTLDSTGVVWKYLRADGSYVSNSAVQTAITGTKTKAGMFYDATAAELIITTTTGTGAGVYPKFVRVNPSTLAVSSSVYSASAGSTFSGSADSFRGGARLNDPLNASAATYWLATTSAVHAYTFAGSTATQTSNRDFGTAATVGYGLTHDGTQFRGWATGTPTKVWKFSAWDWTSASAVYWFGYAWYDSAGTTHETTISPRTSITLRRRERVQVTTPAIPTGGVEDPNNVRIYTLPNASAPSAGSFKLQVTDALTSRYVITYTSGGAADGGGTPFAAGTPATLASAGTGFTLKGSGFINRTGTSFPASPVTGDTYYRSDHHMEFIYTGTRWVCTCPHSEPFVMTTTTTLPITATASNRWSCVLPVSRGLDILVESYDVAFLVVTGGTALGASHRWNANIRSFPGNTLIASLAIDSGADATWRSVTELGDDVVDITSSEVVLDLGWAKTGTPGNLTMSATAQYRFIAT